MSGIDFVADTNILIYLLEGRVNVSAFTSSIFAASVVSEIELMGWYKITDGQKLILSKMISRLHILELSPVIKNLAIDIKQHHKIKLPDAVIAGTAIHLDIPLLTADKEFAKINGLGTIIIPV